MISGRQVGMNALLIRNTHKLPSLEDDQIEASCRLFLEKNKACLIPVHSTKSLIILTILTIRVTVNLQSNI